jgi:putative N6-adenine-specific DNA methylase
VLPGSAMVDLAVCDFKTIASLDDTVIVCNPPYGKRMGTVEEAIKLYGEFGDFLKHNCKGSAAYIYCGGPEFVKAIGLKPAWKKVLPNGKIDGRLVKIEVY